MPRFSPVSLVVLDGDGMAGHYLLGNVLNVLEGHQEVFPKPALPPSEINLLFFSLPHAPSAKVLFGSIISDVSLLSI